MLFFQVVPIFLVSNWKASSETKYFRLLKNIKKTFFAGIYFRRRSQKIFFAEICSRKRDLNALFHGINFSEMDVSLVKISFTEVGPQTTNIAIYNDSLTLMSVIFTTFLHFLKNFRKALEIPSKKRFSHISYFVCVKGLSLDLFFVRRKFRNLNKKFAKIISFR